MSKDYCPKCNGDLIAKKGRYGDFFGCSHYPKCTYTTKARMYKKTIITDFRESVVYPGHYENNSK
jgi:ssDNA-binding Zn-finger/Zn-ribbon topoisomerase 1